MKSKNDGTCQKDTGTSLQELLLGTLKPENNDSNVL